MRIPYLSAIILLISINSNANPNLVKSGKSVNNATFTENIGQFTDQHYKPRPDIDARFKTVDGIKVYIGDAAIHYQFIQQLDEDAPKDDFSGHNRFKITKQKYRMYRLDVNLVGANKNAELIRSGKHNDFDRYYTNGLEGAVAYSYDKLTYKNVYPNIDWVLYSADGKLKHEFIVHSGGNVADIQLAYGGVTDLKLNKDGSLTATTPLGNVTELAPVSFTSENTPVASSYVLNNNVLSYNTGNYSGTLTIDPTVVYSTYYGGDKDESVSVLDADASGNCVFGSWTRSTNNMVTSWGHDITIGTSDYEGYFVKFNAAGARQWATYYGDNNGQDDVSGIKIDATGNIYICGGTSSTTGMTTPNAFQTVKANNPSGGTCYIAKFASNGTRIWSTYYGGDSGDDAYGILLDGAHLYIIGQAGSTDSVVATAPPYYLGGTYDGFIAKFDTNGRNRIWGRKYGGNEWDNLTLIAKGPGDKIYVSGSTESTSGLVTSNPHQSTFGGWFDASIAIFDSAGNILKSSYYGGSQNDFIRSIHVDAQGNAYFIGSSSSTNNIVTTGSYIGGSSDAFIAKFDTALQRTYARYIGGSGSDGLEGAGFDATGSYIYVGGSTSSTSGIATTGSYRGGAYDGVIGKLHTANGTTVWMEYYGSTDGGDRVLATVYNGGELYIAGETDSRKFPVQNAHQSTGAIFNDDGFVVKFCDGVSAGNITGPAAVCVNGQVTLTPQALGGTWFATGDASVNSGGVVTGNVNGSAVIYYAVTNSCGSDTAKYNITVQDTPTITVQPVDKNVLSGNTVDFEVTVTGTGTIVYQWQLNTGSGFTNLANGGQYAGINTNKLTISNVNLLNSGYKYRCIVAMGDCDKTSDVATLTVMSVHVGTINSEQLSIYPNPVTDLLYIDAQENIKLVEITDIMGRRLRSADADNSQHAVVDMSTLAPGFYIVKINNEYIIRVVKN